MEEVHSTDTIDKHVTLGVWVNRSYGNNLLGSTLTLDRQSGALLIAFIALYVSASGIAFWKITRFVLHYLLSSPGYSDGVYHLRQAVLCNSQTAMNAVLVLLNAAWAWRKRARRGFVRIMVPLGVALITWGGFMVAGLFSSRITETDLNEVQLSSEPCSADSNMYFGSDITKFSTLFSYRGRKLNEYAAYTLQCYRGEIAVKTEMCRTYPVQHLPYRMDGNASCPFSSEICLYPDKNVLLDTGALESDKHFGINLNPRFQFRYTRHCAPLVTEGYTEEYAESEGSTVRTKRYFYGPANPKLSSIRTNNSFTHELPILASRDPLDMLTVSRTAGSHYKVSMVWTQSADRYLFTPISALDLPNVRVSLLFMDASEISHTTTTEDPWFNATTPITGESLISNQTSQRYFVANEPTGVLGCATQGYICNPTLPKGQDCRPIYSESYDNNPIAELWNDEKDIETVEGAMGAILGVLTTSPEAFYVTAGVPSLLAGFSLMGPMQPVGLPANQWQKEVEYNFQNVLASMQAANIEVLTGKAPWVLMGGRPCPPQEGCRRICGHQKIKSTRFYSFSMLGLVVIIVLGGIIMILAGLLDVLASKAVTWLSRKDSKAAYAILEWKTNTALQLQRLAHEGIGSGTWSQASDMIPVTERGEILGILDTSDRQHPRLISPSSHGNEGDCSFGHDTEIGEAVEMTATATTTTRVTPSAPTQDSALEEQISNNTDSYDRVSLSETRSRRPSSDTMPLLRGKTS